MGVLRARRAKQRIIVVLTACATLAAACEYTPRNATTAALAGCGGVSGTHGFGYLQGNDPAGGSTYQGTEGDDVIVIVNGPVTVNALGGDDLICVNSVFPTQAGQRIIIDGGEGADTIVGSPSSFEECVAEFTSDCDNTTTTTTTTPLPPDDTEYFVVGDSLCVLSAPDIEAAATLAGIQDGLTLDCMGGRSPVGGQAVLEALPTHPDVLVVQLGTNPGDLRESEAMFDWTVAEFSDSEIYFVTTHRNDSAYQVFLDELNDHVAELASTHSHVSRCDWRSIIADHLEWYFDSVHYTAAGEEAFGQYLVDCMLGLVSPDAA